MRDNAQCYYPSVRKSMKGLDNYAADDLKEGADTLGALGKGQE